MPVHYFEGFYLGVMSSLDPYESQYSDRAENSDDLLGMTVGSTGSPLYDSIDTIGVQDWTGDGNVRSDGYQSSGEHVHYGGIERDLDTVIDYSVTITYANGSTATTQMRILQDVSGRVFLVPNKTGNAANDPLDDYPIKSIRFDSVVEDNYSSTTADPEANAFVTCFVAGVEIDTPNGPVDVARLRPGGRVSTHDDGPMRVLWCGVQRADGQGNSAAVRISPGALGPGVPERAVLVSRQHRILVCSLVARRVSGSEQVLMAAKDLVGLPGIRLERSAGPVAYHHLLLPRHSLLRSHAMLSESLWPGPLALTRLDPHERALFERHYPELTRNAVPPSVRPITQGRQRRAILRRHIKNEIPLQPPQVAAHGQTSVILR